MKRKQRPLATEEQGARPSTTSASTATTAAAAAAAVSLVDLPADAVELVASFLINSNYTIDQNSMTLANKVLLQGVEAVQAKELQQITVDHVVDSTFAARIRVVPDRDDDDGSNTLVHLSSRYLTKSARRKHLRCVLEGIDRDGTDSPEGIVLSPSEDRVAIEIDYENDGRTEQKGVEVFDLVTKERLVTIKGSYVKVTWINDDCFLSTRLDNGVCIWNKREDGGWNSDQVYDGTVEECAVLNNDEVILVHHNDIGWDNRLVHVRSLSLRSGAVSTKCIINVAEQGFSAVSQIIKSIVCDGVWLLISVRLVRRGQNQTGIYVCNLKNNFEMVHFYIGGAEHGIMQITDCTRTFVLGGPGPYLQQESHFSVLKLGEGGYLSETQHFTIPGRRDLRAASKSQIVLWDLDEEQLQSFNAETFQLERSFKLRKQHPELGITELGVCVISMKRKELFVAEDDLSDGVRAYCF